MLNFPKMEALIKKILSSRFIYINTKVRANPKADGKDLLANLIVRYLSNYKNKEILLTRFKPEEHTKADIKILKTHAILENKLIFLFADFDMNSDERFEVFDIVTDFTTLEKAFPSLIQQ